MSLDTVLVRKYEKAFLKNDVIFKEGDKSDTTYFILEGEVRIIKQVHGIIQTLATFKKGDFFGEMSMFANRPRSTTAEVTQDSYLLVVPMDGFQALIESRSDFGVKVVKTLCKRLEKANEQIETLLLQSQINKVIGFLNQHVLKLDVKQESVVQLDYEKTLQNLVQKTQYSSETVISLMDKLSQDKKINITKKDNRLVIEVSPEIS